MDYFEQKAAQMLEEQQLDEVERLFHSISGLAIEKTEGDGMEPAGYYKWKVSMSKGRFVDGQAFENPVLALKDFLDYGVVLIRGHCTGDSNEYQ